MRIYRMPLFFWFSIRFYGNLFFYLLFIKEYILHTCLYKLFFLCAI